MNAADVRRLLAGYQPEDPEEADFHRRLTDLVRAVEDPWNRNRFDPGHLTASAFVLHPDRSAVALVHHAKLDRWLQPGGHVEAEDSTHESAARREVAEECLIHAVETVGPIDLDIHLFPSRSGQPAHQHFDLRWAFIAIDDDIGIGDGALAARWVPLAEMLEMDEVGLVRSAQKLLALNPERGPG